MNTSFEFTQYEQHILRRMLEERIDGYKETRDLFQREGHADHVETFENVISDFENILTELNKYKGSF